MKLRQKLCTTFSGLAVLALLNAGVTGWAISQWRTSNKNLEAHYQHSLRLKILQSTVYRALKEVPDAVAGDEDASVEFEHLLKPAEQQFEEWAKLAKTDKERKQVQQFRSAYQILMRDVKAIFNLLEEEKRTEALEVMEEELEKKSLVEFEKLMDEAVNFDEKSRLAILAQVRDTRETAQLVLSLAAFGTISLVLLLAAYLTSDLFSPLVQVQKALQNAAKGDRESRLDEERADELGAINLAFNRAIESIQHREQILELAALPKDPQAQDFRLGFEDMPSRLTIYKLLYQTRIQLDRANNNGAKIDQTTAANKEPISDRIDRLLHAVTHIIEFGFPLDLHITQTDIPALLYEVLSYFQEECAKRNISIELKVAPEVNEAIVDRLKLRKVINELVSNALEALPERGGRIQIGASLVTDNRELLIEVRDNGKGIKESLIDRVLARTETFLDEPIPVGLRLTKSIIEQHGGELIVNSKPGEGTQVQIKLPLHVNQNLSTPALV